jgi:hypothetical protein
VAFALCPTNMVKPSTVHDTGPGPRDRGGRARAGWRLQLWLLALGRYCDVRKARLAELSADQAGPVLPRVRALLADLTQPAEVLPRGCLVVNAITERTADKPLGSSPSGRSAMWKTHSQPPLRAPATPAR